MDQSLAKNLDMSKQVIIKTKRHEKLKPHTSNVIPGFHR